MCWPKSSTPRLLPKYFAEKCYFQKPRIALMRGFLHSGRADGHNIIVLLPRLCQGRYLCDMLTLAIIEDQPAIREAYSAYLAAQPEFRVVLVASSVEEFLAELAHLDTMPEVVLSDIGLPGGVSGIEGVKMIKQRLPDAEVLLISVYNDAARVFQALCAGAVGYLVKNTPLNLLKEHLLQVSAGGSPMSPSVARHVVQHFRPVQAPAEVLSARELQIVQGIEDGLSYKLIADRLGIAMDTVRSHIRTVYRKLEVNSKGELLARRFGTN